MYQLIVDLGNHKEYIPYYSKWAGIMKTKEIGKCVDVVNAILVSGETGEIVIEYSNQECVWIDGYGEL